MIDVQPKRHIFSWLFLILSFAGFIDAFYLSAQRYRGANVICAVTDGCDKVTASVYSTIGNVPVAFLGTFYYFAVFTLILFYLFNKKEKHFLLATGLTGFGFLASLWFVYLQIFVIKAICLYCMVSAGISTILFLSGLYYVVTAKKTASKMV